MQLGERAMSVAKDTAILLLVSDPIVRAIMKETLENVGYTVFPAGDLGKAVDRLKERTPDLLLISLYVEDISGRDAATYLRTKVPGLRVLMTSGLIDDDRLQNQMTLKSFEVFPKPFPPAEFLAKVKEVLQKNPQANLS
jgi:DNA-binding response OmpR family regulator